MLAELTLTTVIRIVIYMILLMKSVYVLRLCLIFKIKLDKLRENVVDNSCSRRTVSAPKLVKNTEQDGATQIPWQTRP